MGVCLVKKLERIRIILFGLKYSFLLVLEVDFFDAIRDAGEDFVGNRLENVAQDRIGQMFTEDLYRITLMDIRNVCHVNHRHIHADITYVWCLLSIYQTIAGTTTEVAVQAIGITDRDSSDDAVASQNTFAAVAHRFVLGDVAQLENGGFEGGDGVQGRSGGARVITIEAKTEAAHVELALREVFNGSAVVHVAQNLVGEGGLQLLAGHIELLELHSRETVEVITVGAHKM